MQSSVSEYIDVILSIVAIIISIVALHKSSKSSEIANSIRMGQAEMEIRKLIFDARKVFLDISVEVNGGSNEINHLRLEVAKEDLSNAYDEACMKYLDGKIDRERFKKTYGNEIRKIVENEGFKEVYNELTTKFQATVKVYKEWNYNE